MKVTIQVVGAAGVVGDSSFGLNTFLTENNSRRSLQSSRMSTLATTNNTISNSSNNNHEMNNSTTITTTSNTEGEEEVEVAEAVFLHACKMLLLVMQVQIEVCQIMLMKASVV